MKKRFFTKHAKSSAALVSLGIHAVMIVVALSYVAVTVIQKGESAFEAKPVSRPKMQLKKLQVPVNIKKKKVQKPKLRKRIVVNPKLNTTMPDIKMPELSGVKGGLGGAGGDGLGDAAGLGFSMPEIDIFGIKSKGEKVFLILCSDPEILYDELGGIPAYEIIKSEMLRVISELGPASLFNVSIYHKSSTYLLFPTMVPANSANVAKANAWLKPLNSVKPGMQADDYGPKTLGEGGMAFKDDLRVGKFLEGKWQGDWYRSLMQAMQDHADTVFLFTHSWGFQAIPIEDLKDDWYKSAAGKRFLECYEKGKKMYEKENKERIARGDVPRVLDVGPGTINAIYFPDIEGPPRSKHYRFTPEDYAKAMSITRAQHQTVEMQQKSGLMGKKSRKRDYSFNVVHFIEADTGKSNEKLNKLADMCGGEYRTIKGLQAIKGHVK